jgi:CDP-paratose 2-epimerase
MKLLITGGCGFLGSNLAAKALQRGDELVVFDNLSRNGAAANLQWLQKQGQFRFVRADVRSPDAIESIVVELKPDAIFHLAGQVAMTTSIANPRLDFETNALGSLNVLEAVRQHAEAAVLIYSSTNKVYGDLEQYSYRETPTRFECVERPNGFDERTPLEFHSPYGASKGAADQYMLDYARVFKLRTVVFRHSSMYGGRQFFTYDQGWVGWFCLQALAAASGCSARFTISGTGKQVRDVLHSEDMVRLYFAAVDRIEDAKGQVFNIGGGRAESLSLLELFELLETSIGTRLEYDRLAPRESDQRVFIADVTKALHVLGWQPKVGHREGIASMLDWLRSNSMV